MEPDARRPPHQNPGGPRAVKRPLVAILMVGLALLSAAGRLAFEGRSAIKLSDEGYLWYGCVRTSLGEVPVRDFQAYEPGRYLWGAAFLRLLGSDGVVSLRVSQAAFLAVGLLCGLLVLRRFSSHPLVLSAGAVLLVAWMWPLFRATDTTLPLAAVLVLTRLLESPSPRRCAEATTFVGVATFFGRNHGLYAFLATVPILIGVSRRIGLRPTVRGAGMGLLLGLAPIAAYAALSPGFVRAETEATLLLFRLEATNAARDVLFPAGFPLKERAVVGLLIVLLPVLNGAAVVCGWNGSPALLASGVVGFGYLHHALSRPDLAHLTPAALPAWVGTVGLVLLSGSLAMRAVAAALLAGVVGLSEPTVLKQHRKALGLRVDRDPVYVRGERLQVDSTHATQYRVLKQLSRERLEPGESMLVAPMWPGVYPLLGLRSPLWTLMFWFGESPDREREMIRRLAAQHVRWALVCDVALDGDEERRFRRTHPLLWQHLQAEWESERVRGLPERCLLYGRREALVNDP